MHKVGFLAFLGFNYGSTLQSCALYEVIRMLGYDCEVIDCGHDNVFVKEFLYPDSSLKNTNPKSFDNLMIKKNFHSFITNWFKFNEKIGSLPGNAVLDDEQNRELENYDAFICGSDQIWKPHDFWFCAKRYLQFAPEEKRIAYAPSVFWKEIPDFLNMRKPQWGDWISSIKYISARETSSSVLIAKSTGRSVATVLDPTLLLRPEDWERLTPQGKYSAEIAQIFSSGKPYLLAYLLDGLSEKYRERVCALAKKLDLEIIWLTGRDTAATLNQNCVGTDPAGFVNLVRNASFVCIDGFHGTCFSLNFSKPFLVFKKGGYGNDARIDDLLQRVGAVNRVINIDESMESLDLQMDYAPVQKNLDMERQKSLEWLKDALEGAIYSRGRLYDLASDEIAAQKQRREENYEKYQEQLKSEHSLCGYLEKLGQMNDELVIVAVRDTLTPNAKITNIEANAYKALKNLGFGKLGHGADKEFWAGYIAIKYKNFVIYERLAPRGNTLSTEMNILGLNIKVVSSPYKAFNVASIKIDDQEYAVNQRGLNIVTFDPLHKKLVDSVAFDTWYKHIPVLRNIRENNFYDYLHILKNLDDTLIIISARDTITPNTKISNITDAGYELLSSLGLKKLGHGPNREFWAGYIAIIHNHKLVYEELASRNEKLFFETKIDGLKIKVSSFPYKNGDNTSIKINDREYAVNKRGLNIVAFSLKNNTLLDTVAFDTWHTYIPACRIVRKDEFYKYIGFGKYLEQISSLNEELVVFAVKDTISPTSWPADTIINGDILNKLRQMGLKAFGQGADKEFWAGYIAVIYKKKVVFEKLGEYGKTVSYVDNLDGIDLKVVSSPYNAENIASIKINGMEYAVNQRGMNIAIFDLKNRRIKDSVSFDTWYPNVPCQRNFLVAEQSSASIQKADKSIRQLPMPHCTGCGACANLCHKNAIAIRLDAYGFLRAFVDEKLCNDCGICGKCCPVLNPVYTNFSRPECLAVMANNDIRKVSSSGGVFTVAANYVLKNGGYVGGVAFSDDFNVEYRIISKLEDLSPLRGSKYIQCDASSSFMKIKELLKTGAPVLFSGLPCQIAGLQAFLQRDYDNLITLDLLCHGIAPFKVFAKYLEDVHAGKPINDIKFKDKIPWGWHAGLKITFADGTNYGEPLERDPYYKAYLSKLSRSEACAVCKFNHLPRQGDITIGDFWGVERYDPALNDCKGTSVVLLNNERGKSFFEKIKTEFAKAVLVPIDYAIRGNGVISHPYSLHKNCVLFHEKLDTLPFAALVNGCLENRLYEQEYIRLCKTVPPQDHEFYYMALYAVKHASGRKIATWIRSDNFERILFKYFNEKVAISVTGDWNRVQPGKVEHISFLKGKSCEYFLVAIDRHYDEATARELSGYGYTENTDYVFRVFRPIIIKNQDLASSNYYDDFGNSIEGFSGIPDNITICGFNNHVMFGNHVRGIGHLSIRLDASSFVDIGAATVFSAPVKMNMFVHAGEARIDIGEHCYFQGGFMRLYSPGSIKIGPWGTFNQGFAFHVNMDKKIIIGRDCMTSYDVSFMGADGHSIFNTRTGKCTNRKSDAKWHPSNNCVVGEHVWIGKEAYVFHGANIGNGSIVGARCVVRGEFPNNCILVGDPAKVASRDRAWQRDAYVEGIDNIRNWALPTTTARASVSGARVLVAGGNRIMGQALVRELLALGNDVYVANRGMTKNDFGMKISRIKLDAGGAVSCAASLKDMHFDVIFDNIAYCPAFVQNLLANARCEVYVQLSSIMVYPEIEINQKETGFNPLSLAVAPEARNLPYADGKRFSEAIALQVYGCRNPILVRIPFIIPTDRLLFYCRCMVKGVPMAIPNIARSFAFARGEEVGKFLPWIVAQKVSGPINFSSAGMVTIAMILDYIKNKTGLEPLINMETGRPDPFRDSSGNKGFSLNLDKVRELGWPVSELHEWFWKIMDDYVARALREKVHDEKLNFK